MSPSSSYFSCPRICWIWVRQFDFTWTDYEGDGLRTKCSKENSWTEREKEREREEVTKQQPSRLVLRGTWFEFWKRNRIILDHLVVPESMICTPQAAFALTLDRMHDCRRPGGDRWPPRLPDLKSCDFFLWGYVKDSAFLPPLPQDLSELWRRIAPLPSQTSTVTCCRGYGRKLLAWGLPFHKGPTHSNYEAGKKM